MSHATPPTHTRATGGSLRGGLGSIIVSIVVLLGAAVLMLVTSSRPVRAICDRKQMHPGDICQGKTSRSYEQVLALAQNNHAHVMAAMPFVMVACVVWIVILVWRLKTAPTAAPRQSMVTGTLFGLLLVSLALFMAIGPRDAGSVNPFVNAFLGVAGLLLLWSAWPRPAKVPPPRR